MLPFLNTGSLEDLNSIISRLIESFNTRSEGDTSLSCVGGIWIDQSLTIKPSFKEVANTIYRAEAEVVYFQHKEKKSSTPPRMLRNTRVVAYNNLDQDVQNLPKKLQGEAMENRETSQKVALQALRDASATKNLVQVLKYKRLPQNLFLNPKPLLKSRIRFSRFNNYVFRCYKTLSDLSRSARADAPSACFDQFLEFYKHIVEAYKTLSDLSRSARADAPSACFDQFLEFYKHIVEAISNLESVPAARGTNPIEKQEKDNPSILQEVFDQNNQSEFNSSKRRPVLQKSVSATSERNDQKTNFGKHLRSTTRKGLSTLLAKLPLEVVFKNDENEKPTSSCFSNTIKLGKHIKLEAGNWFMEFLEDALKKGLKKPTGPAANDARKVPKSLILKVINWVEVEQCDGSKKPIHPKALQVARKLRIKEKIP
ncbi:hypothetical protein GIB67_043300 [Kingdonia uniflora]|uniref:Uncharacterized protein n=1 Tax=Kingdonia uniflora TaxID=39325 RepID=A0A7J7NR63_9MAGN|nr:hypothetical protein GIB67_043300 [Kingdonia uniflora]